MSRNTRQEHHKTCSSCGVQKRRLASGKLRCPVCYAELFLADWEGLQ